MFGTSRVLNGGGRGAGVGRPEAWAGDEASGLAGEQVSVERAGSGVGAEWAVVKRLTDTDPVVDQALNDQQSRK